MVVKKRMDITVERSSFITATQWVKKDTGANGTWILSIDDNGEGALSAVSPTGFLTSPFTITGLGGPKRFSIRVDAPSIMNALTAINPKSEEPLTLTLEDGDTLGAAPTGLFLRDRRSRFRIPVLGGSRRSLPDFTVVGSVDGRDFMSLMKGAHEVTDTRNTARPYFSIIFLTTHRDTLIATSALANATFMGSCGFTPALGTNVGVTYGVPESAVKLWGALEGYTELLVVPDTGAFGVRTESGAVSIVNTAGVKAPDIEGNTARHVAVPQNSVRVPRGALMKAMGVAKQAARSESSLLFKVGDGCLFVADKQKNTVIEVPACDVTTPTEDGFALNIMVGSRMLKAVHTDEVLFAYGGMNCYVKPVTGGEVVDTVVVCGKLAKQ